MTTGQGYPLVAGGICEPGTAAYWKERFSALAALRVEGDLHSVDYAMAQALRHLAEDSLAIAGCALDTGQPLPPGTRTGGVLGSPRLPAASAEDTCDALPDGFSLHATAGGPGLAALAGQEDVTRAIAAVQALGAGASVTAIRDCLLSLGLETFLFVADGTGPDARGCVIAASPGGAATVSLVATLSNCL